MKQSTSARHSAGADEAMHYRLIALKPETCDENTRSVEAVLATDKPVTSLDSRSGQGVYEVWRMDGAQYGASVPLVDNHNRSSVRNVLGSVDNIRTTPEGEMCGTLRISEAEPNVWTKVREGHIKDVSGGIVPDEAEKIQAGQTRHVRGVAYTAPQNKDMRVVTSWRLREVSLTPIGADPAAKIRAESQEATVTKVDMKDSVRKFLQGIGLAATATAEQAKAFYDSLPDVTRQTADNFQGEPVAPAESQRAAAAAEPDSEALRVEAIKAERLRVKELERLGTGLPAELVRKAIDDGKTPEQAAPEFLDAMRQRTEAATPAIHSRSHETDCTAATLGLGLALRSCDGEQMLSLGAQYMPSNGVGGKDCEYTLRRAVNKEAHKKATEQLLDMADSYRSMSLHDVCREACRIDGKPVSMRLSPAETFRTAVSGSALSNIFTTNVNAQFVMGYTDFTDSTTGWCSETDVANFLTQERDMMGKFGALQKVKSGQTAQHLNTSDWKESYKIQRYGGQFVIDEQDIINDRFGALEQETPKDMGLTAAQLRPNLVYYIILSNPNLDFDSAQLFQTGATRLNKGSGTALSGTRLEAILAAMGKQRLNGRPLNIRGRYLIVPQDLKFTADITILSQERIISSASGGTYNPLKDLGIEIRFDDRMGVAGVTDPVTGTAQAGTATNYLVTARPGEEGAKTIEVGYLRGTGRAPSVRSFVLDKGQWGIGWDVKFDIGAKALDYRAMYFDPGA
jgi:hypothetical protein